MDTCPVRRAIVSPTGHRPLDRPPGRTAKMTAMPGRPSLLMSALVLVAALTACSPSQDEVDDAFAGVEGVERADISCSKGDCALDLDLAEPVTADQLDEALATARALDASADVRIVGHRTRLRIEQGSETTLDAGLGAAVLALGSVEGLDRALVTVGRSRLTTQVIPTDTASFWQLSRRAWAAVEDVPDMDFTATRTTGGVPLHLGVRGAYPDQAVRVVRDLQGRNRTRTERATLTGVTLTPERLALGTTDLRAASDLRAAVKQHPLAVEVPALEVYATQDLVALTSRPAGEIPDLTTLLGLVEARTDVWAAHQTPTGIRIKMARGNARRARRVFSALRSEADRTGSLVELELTPVVTKARGGVATLHPGADPALLALAGSLTKGADVTRLAIEHDDPAHPPRVALVVSAQLHAPELERVARAISSWALDQRSGLDLISLTVRTVDDEGRSPSTSWVVDLSGSRPTIAEVRGTEESAARLAQAWRRGLS